MKTTSRAQSKGTTPGDSPKEQHKGIAHGNIFKGTAQGKNPREQHQGTAQGNNTSEQHEGTTQGNIPKEQHKGISSCFLRDGGPQGDFIIFPQSS
jgi:hypothetical protein